MFRKTSPIPVPIALLALTALACGGFNINIPTAQLTTIPTEIADIVAPAPEDGEATLNLNLTVGEIDIEPGAEGDLVTGTYTYNLTELEPEVAVDGTTITIGNRETEFDLNGFPDFNSNTIESHWDLRLGNYPTDLTLSVGAGDADIDLGGLSLSRVQINLGASDTTLTFSALNNVEMSRLQFEAGAGSIRLTGLANTNAEDIIVRTGAGEVTLEFDGDLQRDLTVNVEAGVGSLTIIVPERTNAEVTNVTTGLGNIVIRGNWQTSSGRHFLTGDEDAPTITFRLNAGVGEIRLEN